MFNLANIKKTWYYLQKNGLKETYYAVRERFFARTSDLYPDKGYRYQSVPETELERQRSVVFSEGYKISILVPMYETKPEFAKAMIDSVRIQTYTNWELILADASKSNLVENTVREYTDERIRYYRLEKNAGISENTNAALDFAFGDYIGLLDHDDVLTPDALFEMMTALEKAKADGRTVAFVYSNEDKCDTRGEYYYEPNIKLGFNMDLLFSNNYICHFMVMKADLMKKLRFRNAFDGAQDFDLVLRAALLKAPGDIILHVEKVLYHWRCHDASTAANPRSKQYAYEAGRRAAEDALYLFLQDVHSRAGNGDKAIQKTDGGILCEGILVSVAHTVHNGFYRVIYGNETAEDIFKVRKDVGILVGSVKKGNKITGGMIGADGICPYAGIHAGFSGYLHRNSLVQSCKRANLANAVIRKELRNEAEDKKLKTEFNLCDEIVRRGYLILYDPKFEKKACDKI